MIVVEAHIVFGMCLSTSIEFLWSMYVLESEYFYDIRLIIICWPAFALFVYLLISNDGVVSFFRYLFLLLNWILSIQNEKLLPLSLLVCVYFSKIPRIHSNSAVEMNK